MEKIDKKAAMRAFYEKISAGWLKDRGAQDIFYSIIRNNRKKQQESLKTLMKYCYSAEM